MELGREWMGVHMEQERECAWSKKWGCTWSKEASVDGARKGVCME